MVSRRDGRYAALASEENLPRLTSGVTGRYAALVSDENLQVRLASRPVGRPTAENFSFSKEPLPVPREGQVLLRTIWLSLDPYMRGRMSDGCARRFVAHSGQSELRLCTLQAVPTLP